MTQEREAGTMLDAEIAERVMGQVPCSAWRYGNLGSAGGPVSMNDGCAHPSGKCYPANESLPFGGPAHFSTEILPAFQLVETMLRTRPHFCLRHLPSIVGGMDKCWAVATEEAGYYTYASTPALAICLAALAALESSPTDKASVSLLRGDGT